MDFISCAVISKTDFNKYKMLYNVHCITKNNVPATGDFLHVCILKSFLPYIRFQLSAEGSFASGFLRLRSLVADSRELLVDVAVCNNTLNVFSNS